MNALDILTPQGFLRQFALLADDCGADDLASECREVLAEHAHAIKNTPTPAAPHCASPRSAGVGDLLPNVSDQLTSPAPAPSSSDAGVSSSHSEVA